MTRLFSPNSAKNIQRDYVAKRLRALHKPSAENAAKATAVENKVKALMSRHSATGDWHDYYAFICQELQDRDLTINFDANRWFSQLNPYPHYDQVYQRARGADRSMLLKDDDPANPPVKRTLADDWVTLPDEWANAHPSSERYRLYNALYTTGTQVGKWAHARPNTPTLKEAADAGDGIKRYYTTNPNFKPKAKQVFAALNYGKRPNGSCTFYGYSFLKLKRSLNETALYYPADTFNVMKLGTKSQASYHTIGALLEYATDTMADAIWETCMKGLSLSSTDDTKLLMEGHIFKRLKMNKHVAEIVLSRQEKGTGTSYSDADWRKVCTNAQEWSQRNGVPLSYVI
jgi:hypothetical protein